MALFDFDGTLTYRDSLADFIFYSVGSVRVAFGGVVLSPIILAYKTGLYDNSKAKEKVISHFFRGYKDKEFTQIGRIYAQERLPEILQESAVDKLMWHIEQNHTVVVVTASAEDWIREWTGSLKVELIGTKLERKGGVITGRFQTKNCYGIEKVRRIRDEYDLTRYETIFAYGDTDGDQAMLDLADHVFYRSFK